MYVCKLRRIEIYNWNAGITRVKFTKALKVNVFFLLKKGIENLDPLFNNTSWY